jgi:hypothetical protein
LYIATCFGLNWPSSGVEVVVMKEYAILLFFCELPQTILGYKGYRAVAMHVFGLFCWFVDFSVVQSVAVLKIFVGAEACCLAVGHHGHLWQVFLI